MDISVNARVRHFFGVSTTSLVCGAITIPCVLVAVSENYCSCALADEIPIDPDTIHALQWCGDAGHKTIMVTAESTTRCAPWKIIRMHYTMASLPEVLRQRVAALFVVQDYRRMRRDERIELTASACKRLSLSSAHVRLWTRALETTGVVHDLSYTGARVFCRDDTAMDTDDKLVLTYNFLDPPDACILRATVVRKTHVMLQNASVVELGLTYLTPIALSYTYHLTRYFQ